MLNFMEHMENISSYMKMPTFAISQELAAKTAILTEWNVQNIFLDNLPYGKYGRHASQKKSWLG